MSGIKTIRIKIEKDGKIVLDFDGYIGRACIRERDLILQLLQQLGVNTHIEDTEFKPSYFMVSEEEEHVEEHKV